MNNPLKERIEELEEEVEELKKERYNLNDILESIKDFCDECPIAKDSGNCISCYLRKWLDLKGEIEREEINKGGI